jgi:hypothetical protein
VKKHFSFWYLTPNARVLADSKERVPNRRAPRTPASPTHARERVRTLHTRPRTRTHSPDIILPAIKFKTDRNTAQTPCPVPSKRDQYQIGDGTGTRAHTHGGGGAYLRRERGLHGLAARCCGQTVRGLSPCLANEAAKHVPLLLFNGSGAPRG